MEISYTEWLHAIIPASSTELPQGGITPLEVFKKPPHGLIIWARVSRPRQTRHMLMCPCLVLHPDGSHTEIFCRYRAELCREYMRRVILPRERLRLDEQFYYEPGPDAGWSFDQNDRMILWNMRRIYENKFVGEPFGGYISLGNLASALPEPGDITATVHRLRDWGLVELFDEGRLVRPIYRGKC